MGVGLLDREQSSPAGPSGAFLQVSVIPLESEEFPRENPSTLLLFMPREMTESRRSEHPVCKYPLSQSGSLLLTPLLLGLTQALLSSPAGEVESAGL